MFANRNGFFYTIDRVTGKVIVAKPFVETTWAKEIDLTSGRPVLLPGHLPDEDGNEDLPRPRRRHQLHVAVLRSDDAAVLRHRTRDVRDVLRA